MPAITNITPELKAHFNALISGEYDSFALFSCFANGEPTAAIVNITKHGAEVHIEPLFVAVTPAMVLTDHDGRPA